MTSKLSTKILVSVLLVVLCVAVIVTVCLLTLGEDNSAGHIVIEDEPTQIVHGELDVSLVRERLETRTLDTNGLIVTDTNEKRTDFSTSSKNIFGLEKKMLIGPTCSFTADMAISNRKPYAFEYWLEIVPVNGESLLADQLELTVTVGGEVFIRRTLSDGLTTEALTTVASGDTAYFTVKLEYLDTKNNNETKNTTFAFDMIVHARLIELQS